MQETVATDNKNMPDLKGYGLRDALFRLEKMGLHVNVRGVGCVSKQSIEAGKPIAKGMAVELTLGNPDERPKAEQPAEEKKEEPAETANGENPETAAPATDNDSPAPANAPADKKTPAKQSAPEKKKTDASRNGQATEPKKKQT